MRHREEGRQAPSRTAELRKQRKAQGRYSKDVPDSRRQKQSPQGGDEGPSPTSGRPQPWRPCGRPGCRKQAQPRKKPTRIGRLPKYCSPACEQQARRDYEHALSDLEYLQNLGLQLQAYVDSFGRGTPTQRQEADTRRMLRKYLRKLEGLSHEMNPESHEIDRVYGELIPVLHEYLRMTATAGRARTR